MSRTSGIHMITAFWSFVTGEHKEALNWSFVTGLFVYQLLGNIKKPSSNASRYRLRAFLFVPFLFPKNLNQLFTLSIFSK